MADLAAARGLEAAGLPFRELLDEWDRTDAASFRNGHLADHVLDPSAQPASSDELLAEGVGLLGGAVHSDRPLPGAPSGRAGAHRDTDLPHPWVLAHRP